MTGQPAERSKQRRRRLLILAAVVLMLPLWYVGAWLALSAALNRGYLPSAQAHILAVPFQPLIAYASSNGYGATGLQRLFCATNREQVSRIRLQIGPLANDAPIELKAGALSPNMKWPAFRQIVDEQNGEPAIRSTELPPDPWNRATPRSVK